VRDRSIEVSAENAAGIAELVTHLSPAAIVVMSKKGIVDNFNAAASELFGYTADEVIGKNIKMLTPPSVSKYHDRFLSTYAKTKIKSVVDSLRVVNAMHKDRSEIQVEISVKEVDPVHGHESTGKFVGFLRDLTQERKAAAAAHTNNVIADMSLQPVIVITPVGEIMRFSPSAEACFGYSAEEVLGKNIKVLMPEATQLKHDAYLSNFAQKKVAAGSKVERVVQPRKKDGTVFFARIHVMVITDAGGSKSYVSFVEDLSEQYEAIVQSEIAMTATALVPMPVLCIDLKGTVITANPATTASFGYEEDEMIGENIKMLMPKVIADNHDGYLSRYLETGVKRVIDTTRAVSGKRKDGTVFTLDVGVREVTRNGKPVYVGFAFETTAEAKQATLMKINTSVSVFAPIAMVQIRDEGTIMQWNPAAERLFAVSAEDAIGQNIKYMLAEPHRTNHDTYLDNYRETRVPKVLNRVVSVKAQQPDGTLVPVQILVKEMETAGEPSTFVGTVRDLRDEQKAATASAISLSTERRSLKAIIAIDVKGKVLRLNDACMAMFGYTDRAEVLGKNVKMLMPDELAARHDGILSRYLQTRVKNVIGTTRIATGKKKGGGLVEVGLRVSEASFTKADGSDETIYNAYIENVTAKEAIELSDVLNEAMMELLPDGIILINDMGVVQQFNSAAEKLFDFKPDQILGKNVKLLMSQSVAKNHDMYLERYRATGKKTAIDQTLSVMGETRTGTPLSIALRVKQLREVDKDKTGAGLFVAFANLKK
jgi:PAS domain S-box-containing protein